MKLLIKIKNGNKKMRKDDISKIKEKESEFGEGKIFKKIIKLMM